MGVFFHGNCNKSITKGSLWWDASLSIGTTLIALTVNITSRSIIFLILLFSKPI